MSDSSDFPTSRPIARWRWWVALLLMVGLPLLVALSAFARHDQPGGSAAKLPGNVPELLVFCAFELGAFAVLWALFWAFSRPNRDQLFLRFHGVQSLLWGIGYSLLMRLALMMLAMALLIFLAMWGVDIKALIATLQSNAEGIKDAFAPAIASRDPLFRFLLITIVCFVVAGLREELWRAATLAGLLHLAPTGWSQNRKIGVALGFSSALFGIGHFYQGALGVVQTGLLGLALGAITLRHRSVWPAIIAHGCFDAASFLALGMVSK